MELMMEKGQSEVTNKIRSAIKQKLSEISDFVDDELPEYIMILVANQRSKSQIEKDLSLFLRNDTINFTNWLWDLLNNLKVGTKNNQSSVPTNIDSNIAKTDFDADDDDVVLGFDPDEHEADFLNCENTNDSIISKSSVQPSSYRTTDVKREPSVAKPTQNSKHVEKSKIRTNSPVRTSKKLSTHSSKEPLSSAVIPVKRKLINAEDEYDPAKPELLRFRSRPAALQANKLLLKAVDDATKSILKGKNIEDYYKPTPIKVLSSKRTSDSVSSMSDEGVNFCKRRKNSFHEIEPKLKAVPEKVDPEIPELDMNMYPPDILMADDKDYLASPQKGRTIHLKSIPLVSDSPVFESNNYSPVDNYSYSFEPVEEARPKSPHFIVTLDGVSRTSFKRKLDENSVDSMEEDGEDDRDELLPSEADETSENKMKLNERCKYWPACKNSDQCLYHHPSVPCKCFPDCKFGDKCLYIHPNCKFDALCSRKDCPFTHVSKRKLSLIAVPVKMVPIKNRRMKVVCKFYPKCTAKNCPFIHPKLCRYGKECRLPACLFSHFPLPSRSQMKWQAAIS